MRYLTIYIFYLHYINQKSTIRSTDSVRKILTFSKKVNFFIFSKNHSRSLGDGTTRHPWGPDQPFFAYVNHYVTVNYVPSRDQGRDFHSSRKIHNLFFRNCLK